MIIPLNERTFYGNISNDILDDGTAAGDVILAQTESAIANFDISDYDCLPRFDEMISESRLKSRKAKNSIVHRVYVFDKFAVNGKHIECPQKFMVFIRETVGALRKIVICIQEDRVFEQYGINNKEVLRCISNYIDNEGYVIDALEYKEDEQVLNFILYRFGTNAKASKVFRGYSFQHRELNGYRVEDVTNWNDIEFSVNIIQMIRKYNLKDKIELLCDKKYCEKRFDTIKRDANTREKSIYSFLSREKVGDVYLDEPLELFGEKYFVYISWDNKRLFFWNWIMNNINQVSNDVLLIDSNDEIKYLKIPDDVVVDETQDILELKYKVDGNNYKSYFLGQDLIIGDEVFCVNSTLTRLRAYNLYEIKFYKESSMLLDKQMEMIDKTKESEIMSLIREEIGNDE